MGRLNTGDMATHQSRPFVPSEMSKSEDQLEHRFHFNLVDQATILPATAATEDANLDLLGVDVTTVWQAQGENRDLQHPKM